MPTLALNLRNIQIRVIMTNIESFLKPHPCSYCGTEGGRVIVRGGDLLENLPGTFQLIECNNCKLLRQDPRLDWDQLANYYRPGYVCHTPESSDGDAKFQKQILSLGPKKRVDLVQQYKNYGSWLDVGCGIGLILQAAKQRGLWELFGLEPVESIANNTNESLSIPIFPETFESFSAVDGTFDIISMWDVLEHLAEPFTAIEKVGKLLKTNGIYIFSTPNLKSLDRKIFEEFWIGYDLPRHLHLFPDNLLRSALKKEGLTVIKRFCFTGSYGALFLSISYWNKQYHSKLIERLLAKGPSGPIFRLLTFLPLRLIDWLKHGTNITYIAKKDA